MNSTDPSIPPIPSRPPQPRVSALAITSLILGLLGFLILPALAGLVCGILALIQIHRSAGALKGKGIAVAGTVVSGVMIALIPVLAILAALLLPALAKAKVQAQSMQTMNNVRQLTLAVHLYAEDAKGVFPGATNWCDALKPYTGGNSTVFHRPEDRSAGPQNTSSYGFNARLAGVKQETIDPSTVMIFELETPGWNISGGPELMRRPVGRRDKVVVGFMDGHSETLVAGPRLDELRWDP